MTVYELQPGSGAPKSVRRFAVEQQTDVGPRTVAFEVRPNGGVVVVCAAASVTDVAARPGDARRVVSGRISREDWLGIVSAVEEAQS
jgi:hypothetical protein